MNLVNHGVIIKIRELEGTDETIDRRGSERVSDFSQGHRAEGGGGLGSWIFSQQILFRQDTEASQGRGIIERGTGRRREERKVKPEGWPKQELENSAQ